MISVVTSMRLRCGTTGGPGGGYSRIPEDHYDSQRGHTHLPLPKTQNMGITPKHENCCNQPRHQHQSQNINTCSTISRYYTNHQSLTPTHTSSHTKIQTHTTTHTGTQPTHTMLQHSTYINIMKTDPPKTHKLTTLISPTPDHTS